MTIKQAELLSLLDKLKQFKEGLTIEELHLINRNLSSIEAIIAKEIIN